MAKIAKKQKPIYSFPTRSICPRCGSSQTQAYSTQGQIQYRKCLSPICRHNYSVRGKRIKQKRKKQDGHNEKVQVKETKNGTLGNENR